MSSSVFGSERGDTGLSAGGGPEMVNRNYSRSNNSNVRQERDFSLSHFGQCKISFLISNYNF